MAKRARCLVLGLDGLPLGLARDLSDQLPNLGRLARSPGASAIRAELPEISPVNWTSFYTATGPGEHGVFGFSRMDPSSYQLSLTDSGQVAVPTIFDRLGRKGLVSRVVNLPNTYPARPLRGMMVAGFVAQDLLRAVYPGFLAGPLSRAGYRLEAETKNAARDPDRLLAELGLTLRGREAAVDLLWPDLSWDLFVLVLTETDRLFHFLFHALVDPDHPRHPACMDLLRRWDAVLGRMLERFEALPEPKRLIVLADHGFTGLKTEVDINYWLVERGLLRLLPGPGGEWDAGRIDPRSKAFALDPGRVYLHTRTRFARGGLDRAGAQKVKKLIIDGLAALTWNNERVINRVYEAAEIYQGPLLDRAPDLVCLANPGFDLKAKFDRDEVFGLFGRTGAHTAEDVFFYDSGPARAPERVRDVGTLVLEYFGLLDNDKALICP
ncbi:MAG: alkaline phosphatase family protein [Desulfovibrionaceae bacterium]|nr:alkaline phosphatase family protein [Desulfovibrionaceae bacterium]